MSLTGFFLEYNANDIDFSLFFGEIRSEGLPQMNLPICWFLNSIVALDYGVSEVNNEGALGVTAML